MTKEKRLTILVIEDDFKHLADAKRAYEKIQEIGSPVEFEYASTLKDAQRKMSEKEYDGIITDIFFPYDNQTRDDNIEGWDYEIAGRCTKLITPYLLNASEELKKCFKFNNKMRECEEKGFSGGTKAKKGIELEQRLLENSKNTQKLLELHNDWMTGKSMHPSGMLIIKEAYEKNIPYELNSDVSGHGVVTEAVHKYCNGYIPKWIARSYYERLEQEGETKYKPWLTRYSTIVNQIFLKQNNSDYHILDIVDDNEAAKAHKEYLSFLNRYNALPAKAILMFVTKESNISFSFNIRKEIIDLYKRV